MSRDYVEKRLREIASTHKVSKPRLSKNFTDKVNVITKPVRRQKKSPSLKSANIPIVGCSERAPPRAPTPRIHVSGQFVYECRNGIFGELISPDAPIGQFLDLLVGVLDAEAPYVRASDAIRYRALVRDFQGSEHQDWKGSVPAACLPLTRLYGLLNDWVITSLSQRTDPLLASFRLDTARFIEAHAFGRSHHIEREVWQLKPMVSGPAPNWTLEIDQDRRLKREITSKLRGLMVRCELAPGTRIVDRHSNAVTAESGEAFFEIVRCHLSQGLGVDRSEHLTIQEDVPMRHDIAEEFRFLANYWPATYVGQLRRGEPCHYDQKADGHRIEVPARLIVSRLDWSNRSSNVPLWRPIPSW